MAKDNHDHDDEFDRGLAHDMATLAKTSRGRNRRDILRWIGGAGLFGVVASCVSSGESALGPDAAAGSGTTGLDALDNPSSCTEIPNETEGPYPGDGTNGKNALNQTGIVRSDIRSSFNGATGTAGGVVMTVRLKLVNVSGSCASLAGYSIYLWHCDAQGRYSMYSSGVTAENYLRGVQTTDANGEVAFTTIVPGCYAGRWPHMHFEIFPTVPTSATGKIKTSQLALPEDICDAVYASSGYSGSASNLAGVSLSSDGIFRDGVNDQMATVTGNVTDGYVAVLNVGVSV